MGSLLRFALGLIVLAMVAAVLWCTWEAGTHEWPDSGSRIRDGIRFVKPILDWQD